MAENSANVAEVSARKKEEENVAENSANVAENSARKKKENVAANLANVAENSAKEKRIVAENSANLGGCEFDKQT